MFLNSFTKFQILDQFLLSNSKFHWCKSQAGPFNHICFVFLFSTLIHFTRDEEQALFERYLFARESGEWGSMMPSPPLKNWSYF